MRRFAFTRSMFTDTETVLIAFSHPDYTVGPEIATGHASQNERLAGYTADQELSMRNCVYSHLAPKTECY